MSAPIPSGSQPPLLICNPLAGGGRARIVPRLLAALRGRGVEPDVAETTRPGDATRLARDAVERDGRRFVVAVGGDGTVNEVVNGLIDADTGRPRADDLLLGVVPGGTGCDLTRTFGLNRPPEQLAEHLTGTGTFPIDVGRIHLLDRDGQPTTRLFVNIAEAGYGALATDLANRLPRRLGTARYAAGILGAVARFRLVSTTVAFDHDEVTHELSNVVIANGQFFGGGLQVAPRALPDDGRFNLQVWRGRPIDVLRASSSLRQGRHLARDDVHEWQSAEVRIQPARPLLIEADGEVLGTTPARFDLLPRVLTLRI